MEIISQGRKENMKLQGKLKKDGSYYYKNKIDFTSKEPFLKQVRRVVKEKLEFEKYKKRKEKRK